MIIYGSDGSLKHKADTFKVGYNPIYGALFIELRPNDGTEPVYFGMDRAEADNLVPDLAINLVNMLNSGPPTHPTCSECHCPAYFHGNGTPDDGDPCNSIEEWASDARCECPGYTRSQTMAERVAELVKNRNGDGLPADTQVRHPAQGELGTAFGIIPAPE